MNITVYPLSAFFGSRVWSRRAWHGAGKLEAERVLERKLKKMKNDHHTTTF